ncbi:MAG: hypothetical protein AABY84_08520 [Candidatus Firestonebacteria bacterium]
MENYEKEILNKYKLWKEFLRRDTDNDNTDYYEDSFSGCSSCSSCGSCRGCNA